MNKKVFKGNLIAYCYWKQSMYRSVLASPKAKLYKGTPIQKSGKLKDAFVADKEYNGIAEHGFTVS